MKAEAITIFKRLMTCVFIVSILNLTSCTILLPLIATSNNDKKESHEEMMNVVKNKSLALKVWGMPQKRENIAGKEIWYYDLGSISTTYGNVGVGTNRLRYNEFSGILTSYIELHFEGDNVVHWRTQGVNYSKKKDFGEYALYGMLIDLCALAAGLLIQDSK